MLYRGTRTSSLYRGSRALKNFEAANCFLTGCDEDAVGSVVEEKDAVDEEDATASIVDERLGGEGIGGDMGIGETVTRGVSGSVGV